MKRIKIQIEDQIGLAELLESSYPDICEEFCKLLPLEEDLHYAKIAGEEMIFLIPKVLPYNPSAMSKVDDVEEGSIAYFPDRQMILIFYGRIQEKDAKINCFARIVENLEGIKEAGEKVRINQGKKVIKIKVTVEID